MNWPAFILAAWIVSLAFLGWCYRNAPAGREDERGFHYGEDER